MKKNVLVLLLVLAMAALMLPACTTPASQQSSSSAASSSAGSSASSGSSSTAITKDNIKIGFVHVSDPSDMGYTYNHDLGTKEMQKALGLRDDQIINKFNVPEGAQCDTALRELVDAGCNIIFATSFGFENYMIEVAKEYPNIVFCHATGYQATGEALPNFHNYFASIYEARYLAGIAAGLKTQTNKLGYVAAFPFAEVISGYTAFYLGARSVNPNVTMEIMYTNSWNDPTVEAQVTKALIARGCDVISQHSDSTAPATTAEENGVWQVGYNNDMISAAPKASLISARIDWGIYVTFAVQSVLDGTPIPVDWCKGLKDGAVYLSPLNTAIAAEGTQAKIDEATKGILDGSLKVFAGPLTGEGVDFSGNKISIEIKAGEFFPEQVDASAPSWCYIIPGCTVLE